MTIEFSALHLIIDNQIPSPDSLKKIFISNEEVFDFEDSLYIISTSVIDDQFFWFYASYGNRFPYSETVYNIENKIKEKNPKTTTQVETSKQVFALYDSKNKVLYLSNKQKKSIFEKYLNSLLNKQIVIKSFFKTVDEFCEVIRKIKHIKFVAKRNLFSVKGETFKIFSQLKDLFGLGMIEDFSLEANFSNASITPEFISNLKKMVGWEKNQEADSLICIGFDDNNIETVFNVDTFIQKISIPGLKNDLGMYCPSDISATLINKIIKL